MTQLVPTWRIPIKIIRVVSSIGDKMPKPALTDGQAAGERRGIAVDAEEGSQDLRVHRTLYVK